MKIFTLFLKEFIRLLIRENDKENETNNRELKIQRRKGERRQEGNKHKRKKRTNRDKCAATQVPAEGRSTRQTLDQILHKVLEPAGVLHLLALICISSPYRVSRA